MAQASVILLHYQTIRRPGGHAGHWLGVVAGDGSAVDPGAVAAAVPVLAWSGAADGVVADVWECDDAEAAAALLDKFQRQGSRKRLCSICSPGNARGNGRGTWARRRREEGGEAK